MNSASVVSPHLLELYDSVSISKQALLHTLARIFGAHCADIVTSSNQANSANNPLLDETAAIKSGIESGRVSTLPLRSELKPRHQFLLFGQKARLLFQSDLNVSVYLSLEFYSTDEAEQQCKSLQALSLIPHAQQALCMNYRMTQQESDLASIHHVLDHSPIPALAIDNHFNTIFVNRSAKKVLSTPSTPSTHPTRPQTEVSLRDEQPTNLLQLCEHEPDKKQLKHYITEGLRHNSPDSSYLAIKVNKQNLALVITPQSNVPNVFRQFSRDSVVWVYVLSPEYAHTLKAHPHFQQLGLSATEAELACLLFEGLSLNNIADKRHVSKQTVRKQLQAILKKTTCDTQEELMIFFFEKFIHYGLLH